MRLGCVTCLLVDNASLDLPDVILYTARTLNSFLLWTPKLGNETPMPNMENAKKALRQSIKNAQRNKIATAEIDSLRVQFRKLMTAKKTKEAQETAKTLSKKLDKAHAHGILKKNTVGRYKSRLMKKLNVAAKA